MPARVRPQDEKSAQPRRKRTSVGAYRPIATNQEDEHESGSHFKDGAICSIYLRNFMTYEELELHAGPYLNLIIGPNGTGKSAIVCSIIIGLGGDAKVTGRASTLSEYIRFGCNETTILIKLFNRDGPNYEIQRKLINVFDKRNKVHSEWLLNGKESTITQVRHFVAKLNICVDNLCQFLPQERVVEFVKMNSRELLTNTQKAAGNSQMPEDHAKLIQLTQEIKEAEKKSQELGNKIETAKSLTMHLERQVQVMQEKKQYEEDVLWLEKKRPWIEYENVRKRYVNIQKEIERKQKELEELNEKDRPIREVHQAYKQKVEQHRRDSRSITIIDESHIGAIKQKYERLAQTRCKRHEDLAVKIKQHENACEQIEKLQKEIQLLETQRAQLEQIGDQTERINQLELELKEIDTKLRENQLQKGNMEETLGIKVRESQSLQSQVQRLLDTRHSRESELRGQNPNVYEAYKILEANSNKFRKNIYLSYLDVNVNNEMYRAQVESVLPRRDLFTFIFEDADDLRDMQDMLRNHKLRISTILAPDKSLQEILQQRPYNREFLAKYGFMCWSDELFTCPDPVKAFFCLQYKIHKIPVGDEKVNSQQLLQDKANIRVFFTGKTRFQLITSRFDGALVVSSVNIADKSLLHVMDERKIQELNDKISKLDDECQVMRDEISQKQAEIVSIQKEFDDLKKQQKMLCDSENELKRQQLRINQKRRDLANLENERFDLDALRAATSEAISKINHEAIAVITTLEKLLETTVNTTKDKVVNMIAHRSDERIFELAQNKVMELESTNQSAIDEVAELNKQKAEIKREAQQKIAIANQATGTKPNQPLSNAIKKKFSELPNTLDEIDQKLRTLMLRMQSLELDTDSSVMKEYGDKVSNMNKMVEQMEELLADIELRKRNRDNIKDRWLSPLRILIEKINENFSNFMQSLAYDGQVQLTNGGNEDNFEEYGISIFVSFRKNEKLQELSAFHQSGGERSVSTMIFMIALQELTNVPFRCVDEINQGMDDRNERLVFDLIVNTAKKSNSQYFLLSPKLLDGLQFPDGMQLHVVFNGPDLCLTWESERLYED